MSSEIICITGNTATGTTTLTRKLGTYFGWDIALSEEYLKESPYFEKFILNPSRWAFHNQAFFLANYLAPYYKLTESNHNSLLLDYSIYELLIYADAMYDQNYLDANEVEIIRQLFRLHEFFLPKPTKIIFLTCSINNIIERLKDRARKYEEKINTDYIVSLQRAFDVFYSKFNICPILRINSTKINFFDSNEIETIAGQILEIE